MAGFIFGGNTGTSAEDLAKRRKVIDALRDRSTARMPRDVGEGIYALGTAIVGRAKDRKLDPLEDAERGRAGNAFEAITSQLTGYRPSTGAPMSAMPMAPRSESAAIGDDAMAAIGRPPNAGGYRESLIGTESGGNWGAQNNEVGAGGQAGHYGRVQFGRARLQDAMEAGAIPQGTTPEAFMASPELQMAAENWHFADLESELAPYVGTVVNGQPLDMGALVAMGHLGGAAGARRFVESGGQYNPSDAYGTSLADYARTHGGQGGGGGQSAGAGSTGVNPQIITQLAELAQNPYLPEGQKLIVQQLLGTQLAQMGPQDPMAALELERAQLEIEALRNPTPEPVDLETFNGPDGTVYSFNSATGETAPLTGAEPVKPGYRQMSAAEVSQLGYPPGAYQMSPEGKVEAIGGGGVTVNNNTGGDDEKFQEAFAKGDAATIETVYNSGLAAQRNLGRIDQLGTLLDANPTGAGAAFTQFAGSLGIPVDGLDEIQAAQALINSLVPEQRQPGSGPMSDADLALFKQSLPQIINQPGGNKIIIDTMRAIAQYDAAGAEIVQALRSGEMTRAEAFDALQARPNPLAQAGAPPAQGATAQPAAGGSSRRIRLDANGDVIQ